MGGEELPENRADLRDRDLVAADGGEETPDGALAGEELLEYRSFSAGGIAFPVGQQNCRRRIEPSQLPDAEIEQLPRGTGRELPGEQPVGLALFTGQAAKQLQRGDSSVRCRLGITNHCAEGLPEIRVGELCIERQLPAACAGQQGGQCLHPPRL